MEHAGKENAMIDSTFNRLKKIGAILTPPVKPERVVVANEDLASGGFGRIPDDYAELLMRANGIISPVFVLLGTEPLDTSEPDIYMATEKATADESLTDGLVLGHVFGNLRVTYSAKEKKYQLCDKASNDILYEYSYISDFINDWLNRKKL
jgi:hypothetical protein